MPNFIEIGQELFELIEYYTDRQTDTHTHRQIHADENNTSPKTKFLGEVTNNQTHDKHKKNSIINNNMSKFGTYSAKNVEITIV